MSTLVKIAAVLLLCAGPALAEPQIGIIAPLSGPAASSGRWILQGLEIAKIELEKAGKGVPLVQVEDDGCTSQGGLNAYKALRRRGISLIVGPVCNAAAVPLAGPAEREDTTLIATGVPSKVLLDAGPSVYTILPPVRDVARAIVQFAIGRGGSRFAALFTPDEFGEENFRTFSDAAAEGGKAIVYSEQFVPGSTDFRNFLLKARQANADSHLVAAYVGNYVTFLRQAGQFNTRVPLFAVPTFQAPEVASLPPPSFDIFYSYPGGTLTTSIQTLRDHYVKEHAAEGNMIAMHVGAGRDGLLLAYDALQKCTTLVPACIRQTLLETRDFAGMNGTFSIDKDGNRSREESVQIRQLTDGRYNIAEAQQ